MDDERKVESEALERRLGEGDFLTLVQIVSEKEKSTP